MTDLIARPVEKVNGVVKVPGDKSITHRAILLGALAEGTSIIKERSQCRDCTASLNAIHALGISTTVDGDDVLQIHGKGLQGLTQPQATINCMRSGTTMRLITGILAGQEFNSTLSGDPQLNRRPMERVAKPLRDMGARIETVDGHAPMTITGSELTGIEHEIMLASAQVKSAILLAGLYAKNPTIVHQNPSVRDHTELLLKLMGVKLQVEESLIKIEPSHPLMPFDITVPGDPSSAAFPLAAALLVPGSRITCLNVNLNPTRCGFLDVLKEMGAWVKIDNLRTQGNELVGDIRVSSSTLRAISIKGDTVIRMIDEFPILAILATQANGSTMITDAAELRVKETDRIATLAEEITKLGAQVEVMEDGFIITGPTPLTGSRVNSHGDHRLAMALAIAGLIARDETIIENCECIPDSFPGFIETMNAIGADYDQR